MSDESRDYLTGLYTRQALYNMFESMEAGSRFQFMFIDLDNFKNVNDVYGHNEGDALLKAVAHVLKDCAPRAKAIRLGGDEFVLLFEQECSKGYLCATADRIIERISQKEGFENISIHVSASVGILHNEKAGGSLDEFLLKSDKAMYHAKTHGKGHAVVFNDIAEDIMLEVKMEKLQQEALEQEEFELRFLPVVSAQTSKLKMAQVRLFWKMSDGTELAQDKFLGLFERNGFIRELDLWLIHKVFDYLKEYHGKWQRTTRVGFRISRLSLVEKNFPHMLKELADSHGIAPHEVDIEVDENVFERDSVELFVSMELLKGYGFSLSVTGVGAEFKSMKYWDMIEFNSIIFDSDFVKRSLSSNRGQKIIRTLLDMGRQLNMEVMAEGISTREEASFFDNYGCNTVSGSYYSEPLVQEDYWLYIQDKIVDEDERIAFPFKEDFNSVDGKYVGEIIGEGICLTEGISDNWGGVYFPGGHVKTNVLRLPNGVVQETSYTICMWLKPVELIGWASTIFVGCHKTFLTFSPYVVGGLSIGRTCTIEDSQGYFDVLVRQVPLDKWTFVTLTYDARTGVSRVYMNGLQSGKQGDVPPLGARMEILLGGDHFQPSYHGYLSGLQFYESVKSSEEILAIYEGFRKEKGFRAKLAYEN